MPTRTLPALRTILDAVDRYRRIAIADLNTVMPEFDDITLDFPRIGYARKVGTAPGAPPEWRVIQCGVPWDHTIHALRHYRALAAAFDGYVFVSTAYTTEELALEASFDGLVPPQVCDSFTLMVWPVFAVRFKSGRWLTVARHHGPGVSLADLLTEAYG